MKVRKNFLAWIGIVLAVLGMGVVLISNISKWFVLIPVVVLVAALVALLKGVAFTGLKTVRWTLVIAWTLAILFAVATVWVAVSFGWLALLPFVLLCGAMTWLVYLLKKALVWLPAFALIIAIIWLGVYAIMGSFMRDWNAALDTLTVNTLIVENADIENADIENADVENENVNNQNVNNQKVENSEVNNQKVENQQVNNQTVNKQDKEDGSKKEEGKNEEAHKHSNTSKVVAPTCTEKGYTLHSCSCGHNYKDAYKDALGHKYTSKVVAPTTTAQGYTLYTCERCGHSYKDSYTDKLQPVVTPKFTIVDQGEGWWTVKFEGMNSANIEVDDKNKCEVQWLSENSFKVVNRYDGSCYFSVTDNASGEVAYLF